MSRPRQSFKCYVNVPKEDLYRYHGATGVRGFFKNYFTKVGFNYTVWMRTTAYLRYSPLTRVPAGLLVWRLRRLSVKFGINIPYSTRVGPGFFIGHFGGIVVNEKAVIGRNCNISHGVTIGQKNRESRRACPKIGDFVYMGPYCTIIGGVSVGSNVTIGAHAVVVHNVGDNEVVAGNPARRVSLYGAKDYVNWTIENPYSPEPSDCERRTREQV